MYQPQHYIFSRALALSLLFTAIYPAQAKISTWKDVQGATFRGEPTEILGPFVLFHTGNGYGKHLPLRAFSPEECRRIQAEIAPRPPRAGTFADAKGRATMELVGHVLRVDSVKLVPVDLAHRPEPELLLVLCGSHNDGEGWFMAGNMNPFYQRVQRVYPGLMEAIFLGTRHNGAEHTEIATTSAMPWLVADFTQQGAMPTLTRFLPPEEGSSVALLSRQGVPLVTARGGEAQSLRVFLDQVAELLWLIAPANPAGWPDRLHYLNATRPVEFAQGHADPVLVGNPLRAEGLRKYGVKRIAARLAVAADGKVTPTLLSGVEDVPAPLVLPLTTALAKAVVAPAIDRGQPVAGSLDYLLEMPPADPGREVDQVWLSSTAYPVLPLEEWLVLRPIQVQEKDFDSQVVGETTNGSLVLNAMEVNNSKVSRVAQMSAFNRDWFATDGADSVRPKEGDKQKLDDGTVLTWQKVRSKDGFVDMQTGIPKDYTVGYAWTEFTVPIATDAWLGLGSDDGVNIWLNGELVHDRWIRRPSRIDEDVVALHLKKGSNRMLIKIQNVTLDWSFIYRLRLFPRK
jgi:hypothetical protein